MDSQECKRLIRQQGFVPILRTGDLDTLIHITRAVVRGGARVMEYTMTTPGLLDNLGRIRDLFPDLLIGIGTVMRREDAHTAIRNGAEFIVSPVCVTEIAPEVCSQHKLLMLGAFTPTEIWQAYQSGSEVVKVFPANICGPGYIKDIQGPLPEVELFMTGGIDLSNARTFLDAGAVAIGLGGSLFRRDWIRQSDWDAVTRSVEEALQVCGRA